MKKIIFIITIIASTFIINNFVQSIYNLWRKKDLVVEIQRELEAEKKENKELKDKLQIVNNPEFVEEEARNKLFLTKPGEERLIVDSKLLEMIKSKQESLLKKDDRSNSQKWWDLFFREQ